MSSGNLFLSVSLGSVSGSGTYSTQVMQNHAIRGNATCLLAPPWAVESIGECWAHLEARLDGSRSRRFGRVPLAFPSSGSRASRRSTSPSSQILVSGPQQTILTLPLASPELIEQSSFRSGPRLTNLQVAIACSNIFVRGKNSIPPVPPERLYRYIFALLRRQGRQLATVLPRIGQKSCNFTNLIFKSKI